MTRRKGRRYADASAPWPVLGHAADRSESAIASELPHQRGVELVARAVRDDVADEVHLQQREVADHVEDLVPDALVGEAERRCRSARRARRSAGRPRSSARRCPPARSASASASSRNVRLGGQLGGGRSRARRRGRGSGRRSGVCGRSRGGRRARGRRPSPGWAVRTACPSRTVIGRSIDQASGAGGRARRCPARGEGLDERPARAVAAGGLGGVDLDQAVVDPQAGQGGHDVLDHLDDGLALAGWSSAAGGGSTLRDVGRDRRPAGQVGADEDDAGVGAGRAGTARRRRCPG